MRRMMLALAVLWGCATSAFAQSLPQKNWTFQSPLISLGYCQLSVTTAVSISTCSGGIPAGAFYAFIVPETNAIRIRDDGTNPTTTVGMPVSAGVPYYATATAASTAPLSSVAIISQSGTATVNITFYKIQ